MAIPVSRTKLVAGGLLAAAVLAAGAGGWSSGRGAPSAATPPAAQSPAKPAAAPETVADRLDHWLAAYEQRRGTMRGLHAVVQHTRHDPAFGQKTILDEDLFLKRPGLLRVDEKERAKGKDKYQRIVVLTTNEMRLFNFEQRIEWVMDTSPPVPKEQLEWLVGAVLRAEAEWARAIYGGLSAKKLRSRFDLRLTKEDDNWVYIEGRSRTKEDQSWFTRGQMVLNARTHLVRRIWLESPNRNEDTWDFLKVEVDPAMAADTFTPPLPKGWRREMLPSHPDDRSAP